MVKIAYYQNKEVAKEPLHNINDPDRINELLEFHNRILKEQNIDRKDESNYMEYYTQISA